MSFHGRTMGALALTGQPGKAAAFAPLPGGVRYVPYGDAEALAGAVSGSTAMVLLEPMLGEGGVLPAPAGYLAAAASTASDAGALFAVDEVQTGIGRTGSWFMHQADGVAPDVITLAKALGGGLPMGALLAFGEAADLLTAGSHGSTFGGNPIAAAAALAVLDTIRDEGLLERAKELEHRFTAGIEGLGHAGISGVRGRGALLGVVLTAPVAGALEAALRDAGFLTNAVAPDVLRLAPPLVLSDAQVDALVAALPAALDTALETEPVTRHFLKDDDLTPGRAGRGAGAGRVAEGDPAHRRGAAPLASPSGPRAVAVLFDKPSTRTRVSFSDRGRRARRLSAGDRRGQQPARPRRADRGHDPGARPADRRDRVADLRAGPHRGHGLGQPGAGGQRADRRVPPVPDPGRPADRHRAQGLAGRARR